MPRSASFCGVILAAGSSSRMGRDKALLPWPPDQVTPAAATAPTRSGFDWHAPPVAAISGTFLSAQIELLRQCTDLVVVVAGANRRAITPVAYSLGAFIVENPAPERGQFSSLRVGLQDVLNRGRDAAIVSLVDRPPALPATVTKIREVFVDSDPHETWAVIPEFEGRHGHPIVVGREMITTLLRAPQDSTARDIEHAHQAHIIYVPVEDPNICVNINTPEDYEKLSR